MDIQKKLKKTTINYRPTPPIGHPAEFIELETAYDPTREEAIKNSVPTYQKPQKKLWLKIMLGIFGIILILGASYSAFLAYKVYATGKKISVSPEPTSFIKTFKSFTTKPSVLNLKGEKNGRMNILLLGIAGKGKPGQNLTDTIIVLSIDTKTNRIALLSIPRDLFVEVPGANYATKINSIYQYGINSSKKEEDQMKPLIEVIKDVTSLDINYYAVLNFDGFRKAIDAIDGINVISEKDLYDSRYPGPNYSYETFKLEKGFHHFDGATALKYARVRHGDPEGDFGRAKRQQQVMQAFKNKFFSIGTFLNVFALNDFLNALGENIKTDVNTDEMGDFLELSKKLDTQNINNMVLDAWDKDSLLKISRSIRETIGASALVPRVGNYSEIQDLAQNIFNLNELQRRRDEISKENASLILVNQSGDYSLTEKIRKLLGVNLNYKNITVKNLADKNIQEKTTVYDLTGSAKLFTLDELLKKLSASTVSNPPSYIKDLVATSTNYKKSPDGNERSADSPLVIVLGKDLAKTYNIEEGTIEDLESSRDNEELLNFNK